MELITSCRVCSGKNIVGFFDLGKQPLANSLLDSPSDQEEKYPLSLSYCKDCSLVQLDATIPPEVLFKKYVWVTGTSKVAHEHAEFFLKELVARVEDLRAGYVLEVASNDGTFLIPFMREGFKVLGVDPAENIAKMANDQGIPTEAIFWGAKTADEVVSRHGKAQMVFARNVLPHVADTRGFVEGLSKSVTDNGTVAIEAHYAKTILDELHYDSIYHEHLCYFTLKSLERLLNDFGLYIFDIAKSPISGGSMIVYAKKTKTAESDALNAFRSEEKASGCNGQASWEAFAKRSFEHRDKLLALLNDAKTKNMKVVGWGASARSSTMLNFCGITTNELPVIIDLNPLKQGKYTAGTHIPIKGSDEAMATAAMSIPFGVELPRRDHEHLEGQISFYRGMYRAVAWRSLYYEALGLHEILRDRVARCLEDRT